MKKEPAKKEPAETKGKGGRPKLTFTKKDHELVRMMKAYGATTKEICQVLSAERADGTVIGTAQLYKYFRKELETAEVKANAAVAQALYKSAVRNGNVNAQKFWLQSRAGWTPSEERKLTGDLPTRFTLNINGNVTELTPNDGNDENQDE